jgi:hypothetical protein
MSSSKAAKSRTDEPVEAVPQDSESARPNDESDSPSGGDLATAFADSTKQDTTNEAGDAASKAQDRLARFKALKARAVSLEYWRNMNLSTSLTLCRKPPQTAI